MKNGFAVTTLLPDCPGSEKSFLDLTTLFPRGLAAHLLSSFVKALMHL